MLLSAEGVHRGHDGVRHLAAILRSYVPEGRYRYRQVLAAADAAMLRWTADGETLDIYDGADSYVVRDDRIVLQTIHYSTESSPAASAEEEPSRR